MTASRRRSWRPVLAGVGLLLAMVVLAPAAAAAFHGSGTASLAVGTASVAPPTALTPTCSRVGNVLTVTMTWTGSGLAAAYDVQHRLSTATEWTASGSVTAPTTTLTISGLDRRLAYDVRVTARVGGWTAVSTPLRVADCA